MAYWESADQISFFSDEFGEAKGWQKAIPVEDKNEENFLISFHLTFTYPTGLRTG